MLAQGEVALARDDTEAAAAAAREARAPCCGSAPDPGHLRAPAGPGGGPAAAPPRARPAGSGDLTDRELAVLRRLTGTASAREIAAELYVSHNT